MTFRPSPLRTCIQAICFLSVGLFCVVVDGIPLVGRIAGFLVLVLTLIGVWVLVRFRLSIADGVVRVRHPFGDRKFVSGESSIRVVALPAGLRDGKAIQLTNSTGRSSTVPLAIFARQDRTTMVRALRDALGSGAA